MAAPCTWVVVANGSRARFLASDERLEEIESIVELEHPASRAKAHELTSDDRGRTRPRNKDSHRGAAIAYTTPPHEVELDRFSRQVADRIRTGHAINALDALVLVASPEFLGKLQARLSAPLRRIVRASIPKDYTNDSPEIALGRIRAELARPD